MSSRKQRDVAAVAAAAADGKALISGAIALKLLLFLAITLAYVLLLILWPLSSATTSSLQCGGKKDCAQEETTGTAAILDSSNSSSSSVAGGRPTSLGRIVFGIAATARLWEKRQNYVKLWWRPNEMRGFVWLDQPVDKWSSALPPFRVSSNTSSFRYTRKGGRRAAIRISRIVSETFRVRLRDVDWFVMGDDDTVFVPDNLVKVLSKYDSRKLYYIGSSSESHRQNLMFSYNMAYGGGGFAISYPLARALEQSQDDCIQRYPYLYGSDDRVHACMAELGVPLTKEAGFHQFDIYGDVSGLLSTHPTTPFISMHHLDVIRPIFPSMTQVQAVRHLTKAIDIDPAGLFQLAICYHRRHKWSVAVSWGYDVQVRRGIVPARDMEIPFRTFTSWNRRYEEDGYSFTSRPVPRDPCQRPLSLYMHNVSYTVVDGVSMSYYTRRSGSRADECNSSRISSPSNLAWISVEKQRADDSWFETPRRQCCEILSTGNENMVLQVKNCKEKR